MRKTVMILILLLCVASKWSPPEQWIIRVSSRASDRDKQALVAALTTWTGVKPSDFGTTSKYALDTDQVDVSIWHAAQFKPPLTLKTIDAFKITLEDSNSISITQTAVPTKDLLKSGWTNVLSVDVGVPK